MNLSTVPTDNLYKFMAIFGLILLITCTIYPISKINTAERAKIDVEISLQKLEREMDHIKTEAETISSELTSIENDSESDISSQKTEIIELIRNKRNSLQSRNDDLEINIIDIKEKRMLSSLLVSELRFFLYFGSLGSIIGSILMLSGFYLWKNKVQRYQDIILKKESEREIA